MKRVYVYCEGQSEEAFTNEVLAPYFMNIGINVIPIICSTKRTKTEKYKGGVVSYEKIKNELVLICKSHKNEFVTTMFDYYGMPINTPMIDCAEKDIFRRMDTIESAVTQDIGQSNCRFHFSLHEFEGMLFSNPDSFSLIANDGIVAQIQNIRKSVASPEHINHSPETAPSKRLAKLFPNYAKVKNGTMLSKNMGIDTIMAQCKHFSAWIDMIKRI